MKPSMKRLVPLIGITGLAGSGKDTLADGIAAIDVYVKYSLADPIKAAINTMFGFGPVHWTDREWKEKPIPWLGETAQRSPRFLAQTLGTEWGRQIIHPEIWLRIADQKFQRISQTGTMQGGRIMGMGMIVPDIRFDNEAKWIKDNGGLLLKVERPDLEEISENSHATEAGVSPALIDAVITNDGPPSKMVTEARNVLWEFSAQSAASSAG
jgi:hypothetical protein